MSMKYSDYDRDILIRTVLGEAAGESPEGQQAVVHVILNRAHDPRWPGSLSGVALQDKQFSAWNSGVGGNDLVSKYKPGDAAYDRAAAQVDAVLSGTVPDVTNGATHYYSPAGMKAHVERGEQDNLLPKWLEAESKRRGGEDSRIGGHIFTGRSQAWDPENSVPYEVAYDPNGRAVDVPQPQQDPSLGEKVAGMVPEITGDEGIDGAIGGIVADGVDTGVELAAQSAVSALFGGGGEAPPIPMPSTPAPPPIRPVQASGPVMFKIKRSKDKERR